MHHFKTAVFDTFIANISFFLYDLIDNTGWYMNKKNKISNTCIYTVFFHLLSL